MKSRLLHTALTLVIFVILKVNFCSGVNAQATSKNNSPISTFGKGIAFMAQDSTFSITIGGRFQSLFTFNNTLDENSDDISSSFIIRRSRLKMDGFAFNPKVTYKIELGLTNRDMGKPIPETGNAPGLLFDAVLKWNFYKNFTVWIGQTKLPGNRERVISSQQLQLVDRSILNAEFNIDRDAGIQLHHHFKLGKNFVVREIGSISSGEGRNLTISNRGGFDYTGRIEFLPFGNFSNKGDYFGADLSREEKPKLSIAAGYDFNDDASRQMGQLGSFLPGETDLSMFMADLMFKYKGFSIMSEYMNKQATDPVITDTSGTVLGEFYTGQGINVQAGYLLKNNIEFAGRFTMIQPSEKISENNITQYTLGISKYFKGHNLKIQTDYSLTKEESVEDMTLMIRFQLELAF